jgi:hypothetical protein
MPATYEQLASVTLTTPTITTNLTGISGAYTDLRLVIFQPLAPVAYSNLGIRLNADTGFVYDFTYIQGNGSTVNSSTQQGNNYLNLNSIVNAAVPIVHLLDIMNYSQTGMFKNIMQISAQNKASGTGYIQTGIHTYRGSSNAITAIRVYDTFNSQGLPTGTTISLYGILKA